MQINTKKGGGVGLHIKLNNKSQNNYKGFNSTLTFYQHLLLKNITFLFVICFDKTSYLRNYLKNKSLNNHFILPS